MSLLASNCRFLWGSGCHTAEASALLVPTSAPPEGRPLVGTHRAFACLSVSSSFSHRWEPLLEHVPGISVSLVCATGEPHHILVYWSPVLGHWGVWGVHPPLTPQAPQARESWSWATVLNHSHWCKSAFSMIMCAPTMRAQYYWLTAHIYTLLSSLENVQ